MKAPSTATQDAIYEALDYDPETGEIRWRQNRRRVTEGDLAGSINQRDRSLVIGFQGHVYQAHYIAWLIETGDWPLDPVRFRNKDALDLRFSNLYLKTEEHYAKGSKADYMREWRLKRRLRRAAQAPAQTSSIETVSFSQINNSWSVRSATIRKIVLASFTKKADAETYARMTEAGRQFVMANPPELFGAPRDDLQAGGPGTLTYKQAATRFAYDPETGAIYYRDQHDKGANGVPRVEIDDTRRPIVRASGRTYSAGMLAWFIHTGGEWPKRKQLGYRDGNRKNLRWSNLFLKGEAE